MSVHRHLDILLLTNLYLLEAELETIIITSVLVTLMVAGICLLVCTFTYRYVATRRRQAG